MSQDCSSKLFFPYVLATDGDSGFHPLRDKSFDKIMSFVDESTGDLCYQSLIEADFTGLYLSDGPHLLKRARYRLLKKAISATGDLDGLLLNKDELAQLLELSDKKILEDSTTNKMRDDLAHKCFSAEQI